MHNAQVFWIWPVHFLVLVCSQRLLAEVSECLSAEHAQVLQTMTAHTNDEIRERRTIFQQHHQHQQHHQPEWRHAVYRFSDVIYRLLVMTLMLGVASCVPLVPVIGPPLGMLMTRCGTGVNKLKQSKPSLSFAIIVIRETDMVSMIVDVHDPWQPCVFLQQL